MKVKWEWYICNIKHWAVAFHLVIIAIQTYKRKKFYTAIIGLIESRDTPFHTAVSGRWSVFVSQGLLVPSQQVQAVPHGSGSLNLNEKGAKLMGWVHENLIKANCLIYE